LVNSVTRCASKVRNGGVEIVDVLGAAPDVHALPVGNAGNINRVLEGIHRYHRGG